MSGTGTVQDADREASRHCFAAMRCTRGGLGGTGEGTCRVKLMLFWSVLHS